MTTCGGGGGGGKTVEPTPPPPPPPSPALPVTTSETFETISVTTDLEGSGIDVSGHITASGRPSSVKISYDAAAGTYTMMESNPAVGSPGSTDTFNPATRTSSGYFDNYTLANGSKLSLLGNVRPGGPQAGMPFQLTYLSFGVWTRPPYSVVESPYKSYFLFGYPTGSSSMPVSGSASYQTKVDGTMFEAGVGFLNQETLLDGTATFTANFGTGAINTNLSLNRLAGGSVGTFAGTGQIHSTNQFTGTFTSNTQFFSSGSFVGGFFGPNASEMGYGFTIHKLNPDPYAGATIQPMHSYITGVVVGKKQ